MRVLVTGYRNWSDIYALWGALNQVLLETRELNVNLLIVHGDCKTGADAMAELWAWTHHVPTEKHPAQWDIHGRQAGPKRNQEMVDSGIDRCLAFLTKDSRGTRDCVGRAKAVGIPTIEYGLKP